MAPTGPVFSFIELKALVDYIELFLRAGEAGRTPDALAKTPFERWKPYAPANAASKLPPRVANLLGRYGWHRGGTPTAAVAIANEVGALLEKEGLALNDSQLNDALLAGSYWLDATKQSIFTDEKALMAIEEFSNFVNGYAQSLPVRLLPGEHPDSNNRRFRAYQRRRFGADAPVRPPKLLVRRLPITTQELFDAYADQLIYNSPAAAQTLAANLAIALGRPIDPTITAQLELTLATTLEWRDLKDFPQGQGVHPLAGLPKDDEDAKVWKAVVGRISSSLNELRQPLEFASDPFLVQAPALTPVSEIYLSAEGLNALAKLDEFVSSFALWIRSGPGADVEVRDRFSAFDLFFRRTEIGTSNATSLISDLPADAMRIIAHVGALIARERPIDPIAEELAIALGDRGATPRVKRTLQTAVAWLNGGVSQVERTRAVETAIDLREKDSLEELEPFKVARQRDAESLLDFGASIAELVRFSQSLGKNGRTPQGWWVQFHRRSLGAGIPTPMSLLERLPDGSRRLVGQYAKLLSSQDYTDLGSAPRALATALGRDSEEPCLRTLAVALSVAVIWTDLERISRGRRSDSLLGAEPGEAKDRYLCGRAQAQLEWGLQELLHTDSVLDV